MVARIRPRVVHGHDPELFPMLALMRLFGVHAICDVHEDVAEQVLHKEWLPRWLRPLLRSLIRGSQRVLPRLASGVVLAEDSYVRNFPERDNVIVVRNFPLLPAKFKSDYGTERLRLVYVGDVRIVRGVETYVRLTAQLRAAGVPVQLRVIGSFAAPDEQRRVTQLSQQLGVDDAVEWLGRRRPEELPELLANADIGVALLHPIANYRESYPTKMFEYMAAGLPVLASNFPLWESVLSGNDCGSVVDPLNLPAAVARLVDYWRSPELRARHGRNGRRAVEQRYQWDVEAQRLLALYRGLG
ncbi:MAG: glycosyltransferase [Proteobacteria bacterium]|nr:glycosyltransferase [Pseudomonadota bacterium]